MIGISGHRARRPSYREPRLELDRRIIVPRRRALHHGPSITRKLRSVDDWIAASGVSWSSLLGFENPGTPITDLADSPVDTFAESGVGPTYRDNVGRWNRWTANPQSGPYWQANSTVTWDMQASGQTSHAFLVTLVPSARIIALGGEGLFSKRASGGTTGYHGGILSGSANAYWSLRSNSGTTYAVSVGANHSTLPIFVGAYVLDQDSDTAELHTVLGSASTSSLGHTGFGTAQAFRIGWASGISSLCESDCAALAVATGVDVYDHDWPQIVRDLSRYLGVSV